VLTASPFTHKTGPYFTSVCCELLLANMKRVPSGSGEEEEEDDAPVLDKRE